MRARFPHSHQILIIKGGSVDRVMANDIEDSWDMVLAEVRSLKTLHCCYFLDILVPRRKLR